MGYQKSVFLYRFQKCTFKLSKKCTQKGLSQYFNWQISFLAQNFLGALFTWSNFLFWNQYEKTNFVISHLPYLKKKSFYLWEGTNFLRTLRSIMQETAQYFQKRFFIKEALDFHSPFKILCHTSKLWNFVKITGLYCTVHKWCGSGFIEARIGYA